MRTVATQTNTESIDSECYYKKGSNINNTESRTIITQIQRELSEYTVGFLVVTESMALVAEIMIDGSRTVAESMALSSLARVERKNYNTDTE